MHSVAEPLPPIPLDAYHLCVFVPQRALEIAYVGASLCFGTFKLLIFDLP